ncbi:methyl-accepting chemotaxis protein [Lysinibacillus sp. NPDC097287]|uniref:methyl-accepting chemotaxis protein n=1 Tax=Lysinibacillus sp. NPDC097287 TaxID=3364144 RepID=UPI0037FEFF8E
MSIRKRLVSAFSVIILFLLISSIISYSQINKISQENTFLVDDHINKAFIVERIANASALQGVYIRSYLLEPENVTLDKLLEQQTIIHKLAENLDTLVTEPAIKEQLQLLLEHQQQFEETGQEILAAFDSGDTQKAIDLLSTKARLANESIQDATNTISESQLSEIDRVYAEVQRIAEVSSKLIIAIAIFTIIFAILISAFITRSITRPITRLVTAATSIAEGDLTHEDVEVKLKDEIKDLATAFNTMKFNLHTLIQSVTVNAEQTSAAAQQLTASTEEVSITSMEVAKRTESLAEGANHSAATGQESSAAMEETAQGVLKIAEATLELHTIATDTQSVASVGEKTLQTAEQQMTIIQQSSSETSDRIQQLSKQSAEIESIVKVITDITEQTNLLALNAAIEAARAGEHGKGFAVVADEVRKLAEESKASAHQIVALTSLIQKDTKEVEQAVLTTAHNVEDGVNYIQDAQVSFDNIMQSIREMTSQIQEVSASTEEISASTEEVAASINEMANLATQASSESEGIAAATEEQSATVQEISNVAKLLTDGALKVQQEVNKFKI